MKKIVCCALISAALSSVASMCFAMNDGQPAAQEIYYIDNPSDMDIYYNILQSYWQLEQQTNTDGTAVAEVCSPSFSPIPHVQTED